MSYPIEWEAEMMEKEASNSPIKPFKAPKDTKKPWENRNIISDNKDSKDKK